MDSENAPRRRSTFITFGGAPRHGHSLGSCEIIGQAIFTNQCFEWLTLCITERKSILSQLLAVAAQ
jgi:hypothetical protein